MHSCSHSHVAWLCYWGNCRLCCIEIIKYKWLKGCEMLPILIYLFTCLPADTSSTVVNSCGCHIPVWSIGVHWDFCAVKSTSLFLLHALTIFKAYKSDCIYWSVFVSFQQTVIPSVYLMVCEYPTKTWPIFWVEIKTELDFAVQSAWGLVNTAWVDRTRWNAEDPLVSSWYSLL